MPRTEKLPPSPQSEFFLASPVLGVVITGENPLLKVVLSVQATSFGLHIKMPLALSIHRADVTDRQKELSHDRR